MVQPWYMQDDGERTSATASLIGTPIPHAVSMLVKAKQLKPNNTRCRNIPLVMAFVLEFVKAWRELFEDYSVETKSELAVASASDDEDHESAPWPQTVFSYAHSYHIEAEGVPFQDAHQYTSRFANPQAEIWPEDKLEKPDDSHWNYRKRFVEFKKEYGTNGASGTISGRKYDITALSSSERAEHNFDHVDLIPAEMRQGLARWEKMWIQ